MWRPVYLILLAILLTLPTHAQIQFEAPRESGRAFALSTSNGLVLGEHVPFPLPSGTVAVDWHPDDARRWARVGNFGLLRFVDPGNNLFNEGVYTFPPFFDGYQSPQPETNKLFVRAVEWSPDGEQLAFYIENAAQPDLNQGLWFYQPLRDLATDPAYQLLRPCPGFCSAAGVPDNHPGWDVLHFEWSPASDAVLVTVNSFELGRKALTIRAAQRLDPPPATIAPTFIEYDYGHYGNSSDVLIVSGRDAEGMVGFGTLGIPSFVGSFTPADQIDMAWVRDAVQTPDGTLLMLGNTLGENAPLQIVTETGDILTDPIGLDENFVPATVMWSPDRRAVLLQSDEATYVATVDGLIYNLTDLIDNSPVINWVAGALPGTFTPLPLPAPELEALPTSLAPPTVTSTPAERVITLTPAAEASTSTEDFAVGTLLRVQNETLVIFAEPIGDADVIDSLNVGQELIITGGPLVAGETIWYRVQTLTSTGWVRDAGNLAPPTN